MRFQPTLDCCRALQSLSSLGTQSIGHPPSALHEPPWTWHPDSHCRLFRGQHIVHCLQRTPKLPTPLTTYRILQSVLQHGHSRLAECEPLRLSMLDWVQHPRLSFDGLKYMHDWKNSFLSSGTSLARIPEPCEREITRYESLSLYTYIQSKLDISIRSVAQIISIYREYAVIAYSHRAFT